MIDDEEQEESDDELLTVENEEEEEDEDGAEGESKAEGSTADDETKNITSCIRLLRFLQLLCEGHHSGLQNHLRE